MHVTFEDDPKFMASIKKILMGMVRTLTREAYKEIIDEAVDKKLSAFIKLEENELRRLLAVRIREVGLSQELKELAKLEAGDIIKSNMESISYDAADKIMRHEARGALRLAARERVAKMNLTIEAE